jgi:L-iditol 2-dehydrogenase
VTPNSSATTDTPAAWALRLHGPGDLRYAAEPGPSVRPGESLVQVSLVGICGSDLHWFNEGGIGDAHVETPLVLGHEFFGVVEGGALGGRRVAVDPAIPCRSCPCCLRGDENLCPTVRFAGHGTNDGGLRQSLAWPTDLLFPLPDELDDLDAVMLEPLGVAIHGVDLAHLRPEAAVVVVGCGPIGLCLVQLARRAGASRVIAIEPLEHRRAAAERLASDLVLHPEDPDLMAKVADVTSGQGADVAFEVSGADQGLHQAAAAVRPGARIVVIGIPSKDHTSFNAALFRRKGLTLVMSRRMGAGMFPRAIDAVRGDRLAIGALVSAVFPAARATEAFEQAYARKGLKTAIDLREPQA